MQTRSQRDLAVEEDEDGGPFKLDRKFTEKVHSSVLAPLLPIMRGLMHL